MTKLTMSTSEHLKTEYEDIIMILNVGILFLERSIVCVFAWRFARLRNQTSFQRCSKKGSDRGRGRDVMNKEGGNERRERASSHANISLLGYEGGRKLC